ncbi:MAG: DNA translocase FtsK, partial [Oscillospiraceae bacterium]|nr:DNA translocase FtsK [Oscillospiraceae bacterium]
NKLKWKTVAILLIPYIIGALYQLLATKAVYELSFTGVKHLWLDGTDLISGGVLSGLLALIFSWLFSDVGAGIILFAMLLALLIICLGPFLYIWIGAIRTRRIEKAERREREPRPKPEPEKEKPPIVDINAVREKISEMKENRRRELKRRKGKQTTTEIPVSEIQAAAENSGGAAPEKENGNTVVEGIFDVEVPVEKPPERSPRKPKKQMTPEKEDFIRELTEGMDIQDGPRVYQFPPIEMLSTDDGRGRREPRDEVITNKERLESALESFGVNANVSNIIRGPSVTRYEMELEAGVKLNKLTNLADDIALSLGVTGVRIAAIPNKIATVGIEVPNRSISTVYLRDIIDSEEFRNSTSKLTFALGKNIAGEAIVGNIAKLPHLLVAGTTGSGKSVCLNSLILSILYKATPDEVKFIMIDPKMVEFKIYNGIPHLLVPVVTEAKKSAGALQWVVTEMMKRYSIFSELGVRDLRSYNKMAENDFELNTMPQIVVVIDELADLMLVAAKEVEESICRVAQLGRAAGIHLVIATQSPRADVITGLMKANIPSRISFKVASSLESRIILDAGGSADKLLGNGDMLYAPVGVTKPMRIQGTWVTDEERESILDFIKNESKAEYSEEVIYQIEKAAEGKKIAPEPEEENGF